MTDHQHETDLPQASRLAELLADERIASLDDAERAELDQLLENAQQAGEDPDRIERDLDEAIGRLLVALDRTDDSEGMPDAVKQRLASRGVGMMSPVAGSIRESRTPAGAASPTANSAAHTGGSGKTAGWLAAAACFLLGAGATTWMWSVNNATERELDRVVASAEERQQENDLLVAEARAEADALGTRLSALESRNIDLLTQLADATGRADAAETRIAELSEPRDPAELRDARQKLLDVNGTIRVAWQPFDVPGLPETEQRNVQGDVVWNDLQQEGYLRFEGLKVNDPTKEQYQVWVIDERGMEQKVSGGVFNATNEGELIVPIEPGIDVGNVQVFAITVEDPGGIWVPDLKRRVVVAPRGEEEDG